MLVNDQLLEDIKRIAAAGYTPRETAFRIGVPADEFLPWLQDENSAVSDAYYTGLNSAELAVRESVFALARSGSSPAQTLALKLLEQTRKSLKREGLDKDEIS